MKAAGRGLLLLGCWVVSGASRGDEPGIAAPVRLELNQAAQVHSGLHHWSGRRDGALALRVQRRGGTLVLEGTLQDDVSFLQPRPAKLNPDWWKIEYGADGLRFIMRTQGESPKVRCDFYLDFGSQLANPHVVVVASEVGQVNQLRGSRLKFTRKAGTLHFLLSLPLERLLEAPVSLRQTEMEVRLYDLDGEMEDYTVLSDKVTLEEKNPEVGSQESE